jgi:hypothetical protein
MEARDPFHNPIHHQRREEHADVTVRETPDFRLAPGLPKALNRLNRRKNVVLRFYDQDIFRRNVRAVRREI